MGTFHAQDQLQVSVARVELVCGERHHDQDPRMADQEAGRQLSAGPPRGPISEEPRISWDERPHA